jgi:hypothetical protein
MWFFWKVKETSLYLPALIDRIVYATAVASRMMEK